MITEATSEQWDQIEKISQKWVDRQTDQVHIDDVRRAVTRAWPTVCPKKSLPTQIELLPSPKALVARGKELGMDTSDIQVLNHVQVWSAWYESARVLGVRMDEDKYQMLMDWALHCSSTLLFDRDILLVSQRPISVHWNDDRQLHNESGPAQEWSDGYGIYSIDGVRVPEDVVLRPQDQTIDDIHKERNEEVRRIRIERFGWSRYLHESEAKLDAVAQNDIEGTMEALYTLRDGSQRLLTFCPSTGKKFALEIPDSRVTSTEEAQARLWGDRKDLYIIGRT